MKQRVVVTGLGCVSPLGNDVPTTWKHIIAGKSGAGLITYYDTTDYDCKIAAEVKDFDATTLFGPRGARRMDRCTQYALYSGQQALEDTKLSISDSNRDRIGAVIGTGIGGIETLYEQFDNFTKRGPSRVSPFLVPMMLPDTPGSNLAINFGLRGPNIAVVTACATGTNSIGEAGEIIRRGQADVMLAGGCEAAIVPLAMAGLSKMGAMSTYDGDPARASRPFNLDRSGFVMGEGAAVIVLESLEHAKERGAEILAELVGYGSTNDAFHISAPAENGAGAASCMQMALESAGGRFMKTTEYFKHTRSRPDRARIRDEWIQKAIDSPVDVQIQSDGRVRHWVWILEERKFLRVIHLEDRETVHNAFSDRDFRKA